MQTASDQQPPRTQADFIRYHLNKAGLSQRSGARALGVDERTMRKYCSGDTPVPQFVMMNAPRLTLVARNSQVIAMIDSGKLSTSDGPLTREQLVAKNAMLQKAIDYLIGRADYFDL